jgi:hypothetical protein
MIHRTGLVFGTDIAKCCHHMKAPIFTDQFLTEIYKMEPDADGKLAYVRPDQPIQRTPRNEEETKSKGWIESGKPTQPADLTSSDMAATSNDSCSRPQVNSSISCVTSRTSA